MLTLSLFNLKDNEDINISAKQAKIQLNENFFKFSFMIKKVNSEGIMIFFTLLFLLLSN